MTLSVNPVNEVTSSGQSQEPVLLKLKSKEESDAQSTKTKIYKTAKEVLEWLGWGVVILWGTASLKEMYFPCKQVSERALIQIFDADGDGQLSGDEIEKAKKLVRKLGGKNE